MATPDKKTLFVDFDNCIVDGKISCEGEKEILAFLKAANSYTEYSPSLKGLHVFLSLKDPLDLIVKKHNVNEKEKIECYTHGRFFTVTEKSFGKEKKVRTVSSAEALSLLESLGYPWGHSANESNQDVSTPKGILEDAELLKRMFGSKHGDKIRSLYDGETSAYKGDESSADMGLLNHLAFWTGGNSHQMERLWCASPLGSRKKTQDRRDYRVRTIQAAIKNCKKFYEPPQSKLPPSEEAKEIDFLYHLSSKGDKIIDVNSENIRRLLEGDSDFKGHFRYDEFRNVLEVLVSFGGKGSTASWHAYESVIAIIIQCEIASKYSSFQMVSKTTVEDAIFKCAKDNTYDSAKDYIKSLTWDRTPRLDTWLTQVYGAPSDAYHIAVGSNWIKGLVKRLIDPGCKFDYVLVLEGPQGTKKSTSLFILGGPWHVETTMTTDNKDFFMQFRGKAIIEFSEGETLSRTEVKRLKAIITMQTDRYRTPFERSSQDFPRRCVFAMTTNETEYLKDDTGNRRWLPVSLSLPEANIEWLKEKREQLFAEAYYRLTNLKEKIYEFPKEETLAAQALRKVRDPNTDMVIHWYWNERTKEQRQEGITVTDVYKVISGSFIHKAMTKFDEMNIAGILRDGLGLQKRQVMMNGSRMMRWYYIGEEPEGVHDELSVFDVLKKF